MPNQTSTSKTISEIIKFSTRVHTVCLIQYYFNKVLWIILGALKHRSRLPLYGIYLYDYASMCALARASSLPTDVHVA